MLKEKLENHWYMTSKVLYVLLSTFVICLIISYLWLFYFFGLSHNFNDNFYLMAFMYFLQKKLYKLSSHSLQTGWCMSQAQSFSHRPKTFLTCMDKSTINKKVLQNCSWYLDIIYPFIITSWKWKASWVNIFRIFKIWYFIQRNILVFR